MAPPDKNKPLVLTANPRLARWLMLEHNERQKHKKVWVTPNILPLSAWLKKIWLETWSEKHLLSKIQSGSLWEKIVHDDRQIKNLNVLHKKAAAIQADKAYALTKEYKVPLSWEGFQETVETQSFFRWSERFDKQLRQWNAIDSSSLMDWVIKFIDAGEIKLPTSINFMGFNRKTPQLQSLLDSIERKGTKTELPNIFYPEEDSIHNHTHISVQKYDDKTLEATTCARWLRKNYQRGKRFGIIVPDLENYRSLLQREMASELCPTSIFPENRTELPFNISLGSPLSQTTPINLILQILSTGSCHIPAGTFYSIIKSPVFHLEKEESLAIEADFRKQMKFTVDINNFPYAVNKEKYPQLYNFLATWKAWVDLDSYLLPNDWAKTISEVLKRMSWPSEEEKLTEKENSIFESWKNCLDQLGSLNSILGSIDRIEAVKNLSSIAEKCFFPEKNRDHLIQVVQLNESMGMEFDHSWIMGCHFEALPPSPEPNNLIPSDLRKKYQLPNSNAKWELENCEQQLKNIFTSSPDIILSYPSQDGDNPLEPSPLIKLYPQANGLVIPSARIKDQISNSIDLELFNEDPQILLTDNEKIRFESGSMKGGSNLLKNQADCPFQAFSRFRLHAINRNIPDTDFDPLVRGNLVHRIFEKFWRKARTRAQLEKLYDTGQLEDLLSGCIQQSVEEISKDLPNQTEFLKIEESRNFKLILEWLIQFELPRENFTVREQEKDKTVHFEGLSLNLRIDRIDETEDKKHILIDYKTGEANPGEWLKERVLSPQLPLYANILSPEGVLFAQTKKGNMGLKGVQKSLKDTNNPTIQFMGFKKPENFSQMIGEPSWMNLLGFWKTKINALAQEFLIGRVNIEPAQKQNTCKNCDLNLFCRIWERDDGNGERGQ